METAKCANCGEDTGQVSSDNWAIYCAKDECKKAFMDDVIASAMKPKRKRKETR